MTILSGIPVLNCHNVEISLAFYQQLLQFVVVKKREVKSRLDWVHIMHGATTLMLQADANRTRSDQTSFNSSNDIPDSSSSSISLYFFVDNIDELHHFLRAKSVTVSEIEVSHYKMKEFRLNDPDGNSLVIGQPC